MKTNTLKVTLETLYNLLFTIGILTLLMGFGLVESGNVEFDQGAKTMGMGLVLILVGVLIYWIKTKETSTAQPQPTRSIMTPEEAGLPGITPSEREEVEDSHS